MRPVAEIEMGSEGEKMSDFGDDKLWKLILWNVVVWGMLAGMIVGGYFAIAAIVAWIERLAA